MVNGRLRSLKFDSRARCAAAVVNGFPFWQAPSMKSRYPEKEAAVTARFEVIAPTLDERARRLWAAAEAIGFGHGGEHAVSRATGIARSTISRGIDELRDLENKAPPAGRQRRAGGGRKRLADASPEFASALRAEVSTATRGDPEGALLYVSKSTANIAKALNDAGIPGSPSSVRRALHAQGFTLQKNRKVLEGADHPDRDAQFHRVQQQVALHQKNGQPVISVDAKKKELVGAYLNAGREWHPKGEAPKVLTHDFPNGTPKAVPYGVYDITRNEGMVNVGVSGDTAEFAVATIRRWWNTLGTQAYPEATDLLVVCDCGGSNGYRLRLWRLMLQKLADETGLTITVAHMPPGTSKWNKIEHRMFSFISMNWRGKPLVSYEVIVQLIGATTTRTGLKVHCELDTGEYQRGRQVSDAELEGVHIERDAFHGEWNYTVIPAQHLSSEEA